MSITPQTASEVLDEIERLEQGITRTLQEIDQKFSTCQTIVTSKILPSIDLYGEASRDVWNHARLWLNFFKAASTSTATSGVATRRAAASSLRASKLASTAQQPVDIQQDAEEIASTIHDKRAAPEHRHDTNDNYNRRESVALFASGMLDVEGSPLGSMPSTPTPHNRDRNQRLDLSAPTRIQWPGNQPASTTPSRPRHQHTTGNDDQGSTTPRVTARDRPMTFSPYTTQAPSSSTAPSTSGVGSKPTSGVAATLSPSRHQNLRAPRRGSFLELDVDQDYQDVVTPPSTLQFSIPESRLAVTPRSVIAKSKVDRILMKDGLVIPQPIFVRDDEENAALDKGHHRTLSSEQNIGSSRKRNLDGDLLSSDRNQFQSKERLLASPRKMASVQDFLGVSDIGSSPPSQTNKVSEGVNDENEEEEEDESDSDGRQSPSRRLMAQIQSQTEQERDPQSQDPLMALVTPPDLRTSVLDYGTRTSIPYRQHTLTSTSLAASKPTTQSFTRSGSSLPVLGNGPVLTTTPLDVVASTNPISSTVSISAPSAPAPTTTNASIRSTVDAIFKESFNSGFAATSGGATLQPTTSTSANNSRRQTMAAAVPVSYTTLPLTNSRNIRNSIGSGLLRSSIRSSVPDTSDRPTTVPGNSRLSLLGSSAFSKRTPHSGGSTLQTNGANNTTSSSTPPTTASQPAFSELKTTTPGSIPPSPAHRGLTRPQGHSLGSVGRPSLGRLSLGAFDRTGVPVTTPPNREHTHDSQFDTHLAPASASSSTFFSDDHHTQFRTPSDRLPPPAPRLGYHSDTLMTQSSLGLNHYGFASGGEGFDDFDRTRTTLASMGGGSSGTRTRDMDLTVGASNAAAIVAAAAATAVNGFQSTANPSHRPSGVTATVSLATMLTTQTEGDNDDEDEDDDDDGEMSRSPCPPGRTFFGANTDLRSVAQAASATSLGSESGSGLFRRPSGAWDSSRR
ncbi:DASH complex subunit ask1 [Haplosporangium bisporale]|nr:DASH complex subunit ask1 [Haplosporangium bisporale]KAF9217857.1 DASH complex subunit ask1 [Podila verticillata]KFH67513.1 hypothetical protein MVEG_06245 [Podila verticillata NRRL 6337]